jgi:hypothetical protein
VLPRGHIPVNRSEAPPGVTTPLRA